MKTNIVWLSVWCILALTGANAQRLKGIVKDLNTNDPLPEVSVVIQGTTQGFVTDFDGNFQIDHVVKFPITLRFSYVGFKAKDVTVTEDQREIEVFLEESPSSLSEVVVTSRRRKESALDVPIPVSIVGGSKIDNAGAFNVNRIKEMVPTVQLYSSNPRNTTLNIRGLGSTFGLTNDGIDPGVGFYIDGVYFARPAATTLDFIDIEQIEVLRGPQGTLFGKNTTAGAFNITTRAPRFAPTARAEISYGNYGYIQAKASVTGPLITDKVAGRISFTGTQRDGTVYNVARQEYVNDMNNLGVRGQLLYTPSKKVSVTVTGDVNSQKPNGYAQVFAGVVRTQRADFRQFDAIIADLNYQLPSRNPFDRIIDHDTPWRSKNELGGVSVNIDYTVGKGTLTSTTAWRYWNWDPSNDRDFTGLPVLNLSQAPSRHDQWSQEVRYAGQFSEKVSTVIGVFFLGQRLKSDPDHIEESGAAQWRFVQNNQSPLWETPGLLDGYGIKTNNRLESSSAALFANIDWQVLDKLHIQPGLRINYDTKDVDYKRTTYGGLETTDPNLIALKQRVYSDQAFTTSVDDTNFSGQLTLRYQPNENLNTYGTIATSYKPVGVNLGGLPTDNGETMLELAKVKPEYVTHIEAGLKSKVSKTTSIDVAVYNTNIKDYQTLVQTPELGVNRGYLSNADEVRVRGAEFETLINPTENWSFNASIAYTDGTYVSFPNAPVPLEEVGGESAYKDISGGRLPGISKWSGAIGAEFNSTEHSFFGRKGNWIVGADSFFRSEFSSNATPSKYLNVPGYALFNARLGFKTNNGITLMLWGRNILKKDYFEQLLAASGSAGHYAAVLGDPRTYGITIQYRLY